MANRKSLAFTLIELLVVIAIIALLLAILLPGLKKVKETAKRTICATHQKSIGQGIFVYVQDNSDRLPISQYRTGGSPSASYMGFYMDTSVGYRDDLSHVTQTWGLGYLYTSGLIGTPETFYCTSSPKMSGTGWAGTSWAYKDYLDAGGNWPWNSDPSGWNSQYCRLGYNYVPQAAGSRQTVASRSFPEIADKSSQLQSSYVLACDLLFSLQNLPHKKGSGQKAGGVNALYSDGSVAFSNDPDAFSEALWGTDPVNEGPTMSELAFRTVLQLLQ